jgi:hypothetical protein
VTPVPSEINETMLLYLDLDDWDTGVAQDTRVLLVDAGGAVAGRSFELDQGLAVNVGGLDPAAGPYVLRVQNDEERLSGRMYMCPWDADDCSSYDPRRDLCGAECSSEDELCCLDELSGALVCRDFMDDDENCGGCGVVCEWDEVCLEGLCAQGQGYSCWETECPAGTFCRSEHWWTQTDPQCVALLVDNDNCGWLGHECADNRTCANGLCALKRRMPCDAACAAGESCCWVWGEQTCVDTENTFLHCGSCDNACSLGEVCLAGSCEPWLLAFDPCPFGLVNCGVADEVACQSLATDEQNCGACWNKCPDSAICEDGLCINQLEAYADYDEEYP